MFTKHSGVALLGSLSMLSTAPAARATDAIPPAAASPAVAADTLIPIESFFKNCSFSGAILSPDARLAVCVAQAEFTRPGEIKNLALLRLYRYDLEKNVLMTRPWLPRPTSTCGRKCWAAAVARWVCAMKPMRNGNWGGYSGMSENYRRYGMPVLIGDPVKDATKFKATSPLQQAVVSAHHPTPQYRPRQRQPATPRRRCTHAMQLL
ncbi:hypothetical protein ACWYXN_15860 [Janthinobacterium aestuarii]